MKNNIARVFLGGDIFGTVGISCVTSLLPQFLIDNHIDFCILNGENTSNGIGISQEDLQLILDSGADVVTGGNHSFEKRDLWPVLESTQKILRPANYPPANLPGRGSSLYEKNGLCFAVINIQGREGLMPIDCPFRSADSCIADLENQAKESGLPLPLIFVDFHAESNEEKEALGFYLAGRVCSVTGTHTHVQTADERIIKESTAFMCDLGMTGSFRSVIGADSALAIKRNITQVLYRMEAASGPGALRGLIVDVDCTTRKAVAVERIELLDSK